MKGNINELIKKLDYQFNNIDLLKAALTHRSMSGINNERLEFLGDAIVNFLMAEWLYNSYPKAKEGELTRLRASLVKGETLAKLAKQFELGKFLNLGIGELKSGGAERESILADAMEAIIAAIYIDGGFGLCQSKVTKWYEKHIEEIAPSANLKDPKSHLQELLQAQKKSLPQYAIQKIEGKGHHQTFYIQCTVEGVAQQAIGVGSSRRKAEQAAAQQLLDFIYHE